MNPEHSYYRTSNKDAWEKLKNLSRENRKKPTETENILWQELRYSKLGFKFRRQHPVDVFIVDFINLDKLLIIEIDGGYHNTSEQKELDNLREMTLKQKGYTFLRFKNEDIIDELELTLSKIKQALNSLTPSGSPSPLERGSENPFPKGEGVGDGAKSTKFAK